MATETKVSQTKGDGLLGLGDLFFMGLGTVIGAGIVAYVGIAVGFTGRATWIAYLIAIIGGFLANLPLILMASAARIHGGNYSFMATTLGDVWGGFWALTNTLNVLAFSNFGLALGLYMNVIFPSVPIKVFAIASILIFFVINLFGTAKMAKVQNVLSILLIFGLLLFGFLGMARLRPDTFTAMFTNEYFLPGKTSGRGGSWGFFQAIMILMGSTQGYTLITSFSGQSRNAKRTMPLALSLVPLALIIIYCSVGLTMSNVLPIAETSDQPLTVVAKLLFHPVVFVLFVFTGPVMALATSLNSSFGIFEKPLVIATRDGWLPEGAAKKNKNGIAWKFMVLFVIIAVVPVLLNLSIGTILSNLTFASSFSYILLVIGIFRYPKTMEGAWDNRAWRVPMWFFYAACVVCFGIRLFLLWRSILTSNLMMAIVSLVVIAVVLVYCIWRKKAGKVNVVKSWELQ